ncbi:hypothetical protein RCH21_001973 [Arthrobacter sp. PL16]|uniref:hypothetical protein n=1 Tax=Arthrobacter sp. PL16 TaxID=3071720 RepID=UPI002DFB56B0|nr:hypothetical protein [Arthrobacter sp. PL16]
MKKTVLSSTLLLLLVTGCGGNPATGPEPAGPTPNPAQTATEQAAAPSDAPSVEGLVDAGSGTFAFLIDQAKGEVVLPAEAPEDVEGLRSELGEDAVTYALVTVQNPEGGLPLDLEAVTVSTPGGQDLEFRPATAVIEEWGAAANGGESNPDVVGLVEKYSGGAVPGDTSELLMIGTFPELPDTVTTVLVQPAGGGEPVEATVRPES